MSDPLRQTAQTRLATLRTELANGRDALTQLEARRVQIADTLLRIEGAVQVLRGSAGHPRTGEAVCGRRVARGVLTCRVNVRPIPGSRILITVAVAAPRGCFGRHRAAARCNRNSGVPMRWARAEAEAIFCRCCGMTSCNPTDVAERYCGYCGVFHEEPIGRKEEPLCPNPNAAAPTSSP